MKTEKKILVQDRQKSIAVIKRNRGLLRLNVLILGAGLALTYFGKENIGDPLIWLGIIIFAYTMFTGIMARQQLKSSR